MDAHQHTVEMVQTFPANIATVHTNAAPRVMFHCLRQQGQFTRVKNIPCWMVRIGRGQKSQLTVIELILTIEVFIDGVS